MLKVDIKTPILNDRTRSVHFFNGQIDFFAPGEPHSQLVDRRQGQRLPPLSTVHREVAGHGSGVRGVRDARAGRGWMTSVKIVGHRETSRFVRTSRDLTRAVAHVGSVRTLPSTRQFLRWAKPCSTEARTAAV